MCTRHPPTKTPLAVSIPLDHSAPRECSRRVQWALTASVRVCRLCRVRCLRAPIVRSVGRLHWVKYVHRGIGVGVAPQTRLHAPRAFIALLGHSAQWENTTTRDHRAQKAMGITALWRIMYLLCALWDISVMEWVRLPAAVWLLGPIVQLVVLLHLASYVMQGTGVRVGRGIKWSAG